jgi:hypothetical protein
MSQDRRKRMFGIIIATLDRLLTVTVEETIQCITSIRILILSDNTAGSEMCEVADLAREKPGLCRKIVVNACLVSLSRL